jgi:hypothetical protein
MRGFRTMLIKCLTENSACLFYEKEGGKIAGGSEFELEGKSYALTVFKLEI